MKHIFSLFCFVCSGVLVAQPGERSNSKSIQYHYWLGSIVKHTPDFKPAITELSQLHELTYAFLLSGKKDWHSLHHFPQLTLSFIYADYGDHIIFGDSFNALVGLSYDKKHQKFSRNIKLKFGVNYSTSPYNRFSNPINNAIGSHINLTAKIDYGYTYLLNEQLSLSALISVMHHSNGRAATPNKGINVLGGQLGLHWKWQSNIPGQPISILKKDTSKKTHYSISIGYARHELSREYNGPKYPIYIASLLMQKQLNPLLKLQYGVEYVYFKSLYHAIEDNAIVPKNYHWHSSKISPYIGLDVLYGNFAISALIGFYPYQPILTPGRMPTKFGFKYYLNNQNNNNSGSLFIAGYLKTHYAVAEYLELSLGYCFRYK